ncbi:T9SS type B sorting domain-containing protein [Flavobacterium channae]|uniref:T9SS type B sorting domain-containing protein n=1 Tax=Flavobacterium channae TaxID=2897181 RepID=UPI001E5DFC1A|nr:T9SS type B sorting domain-containing protein [Flavobacterium channae]UGS24381.1 T9SS type B sorting domain-containing protein [Flavobacterium channae]
MKKLLLLLVLFGFTTTIAQVTSPTCDSAQAMCSGNQGPFNNVTGTPSFGNLGCLGSTPNPAWFYLQVGTSGNIDMTLFQTSNASGNGIDVDFIMWGPFNTLNNICNNLALYSPGYTGPNNVVDCSYSASATEQVNIAGAVAGQYYMLLVTNFSGQAGTYTLNQTGGTGGLSCSIVCGVTLGPDRILCGSATNVTLTANFLQAPSAAGSPVYSWFLDGVFQYTTTTNTTTVTQNGVWSVSVTRPGCSDIATDDVLVNIVGAVPYNDIGPFSSPAGECDPIFDLTEYLDDLVAPNDPSSFTFEFTDGMTGNVITDPANYTTNDDTTIIVLISAGSCQELTTFDLFVDCVPATCDIDLTSAANTANQSICLNNAIVDIVYTATGDATDASVTGLPLGLSAVYNSGVFTISGTPTETGTFNYTVETIGCTPNLSLSGTITINPNPVFNSLTANGPICVGADAIFDLSGTSGATVLYTIGSGPVQILILDGSGNGTVTVAGATSDVTILLSEIEIGNCELALTNTATVTVSPTPAVPTITTTPPTCSTDGFSEITNYDGTVTYTFTPAGPTVGAGGLISGMTFGTSYTVTAGNATCTSVASASFTNVATLSVPAVPTISVDAASCSVDGGATITNYDNTLIYTFTPAGPTVGAGGVISGMTFGTSYVVNARNGSCSSVDSASFSVDAMLITPAVPTISTTAPTCSADGFSEITNYDATATYTFTPAGPTVGAGGLISGMIFGTSYTVTSGNGTCTSVDSASFSNAATLAVPAVPTIAITAPTCSADGFATITNYNAALNYTFTPTGPTVSATGTVSGMTFGTSYVVNAGNGSCSSVDSASFTVDVMLVTPAVPTISTTAPTCSADGFSEITNYNGALTYTFTPAGPTVGAGGLISGMTFGTSYTVTSGDGTCTSTDSASFSNAAMLATPAVPTFSVTAPTCSADGFATITNYDNTLTYTFTPAGPTVGAGGLVSGMTFGTSYVVNASNGSCSSADTASFTVNSMLVTPAVPTIATTAPTCSADGFSTISNYDGTATYTFSPAGPTVGAGGLISGMTVGTSYTVTAGNGSCTSVASASFSNAAMLATPAVPTFSVTAPTCSADGFATITNYNAGLTYNFTPAGPTVGAGGLVSGMTFGTSYVVNAGNGSCSSADTASFSVNSMLVTPAVPTITSTAPTCSADGFSTISNYDGTVTYTFTPAGPTVGAGGLISGMTVGTSYTVTAGNGSCTSVASASFSNAAMLATPAVPTVSVTAPTCSANGFATITNYNAGLTYTFTPAGPTVGAGGLVSGVTFGTSYTVTAGNGSCTSAQSASFTVNSMLVTPAVPTVSVTAPTCSANGFATITNYNAALTYTFAPVGPTVGAGGLISGMTVGTSYTVTAGNGSCTSAQSAPFTISGVLAIPAVPTVSVTPPTCMANGFATITNYNAGLTYTFTPAGPTVGAGGLISGMTLATSYTVTTGNGSCTSAQSSSFSISQQLPQPTIVSVTNNGPICVNGTATFTINATSNTQVSYSINGNAPQTVAINASGVGVVSVTGVTGSTTLSTISVSDGICSSNVVVSSTVTLYPNTTIALVSASGTDNQTRCAGVTIDPIQYQVTGTATNVVVTGLPTGITSSYNAATGLVTISGSANNGGAYNYTITTSGGCSPQAVANGSVTITGRPVLSYTVTNTVCDGSTLDFVLSSNLPGTTYVWSATVSNITGDYNTTTSGTEANINQVATLNNPEAIGSITMIIVPNANGCDGTPQTVVITVNPNPVVETVTVTDDSVCSGSNVHVEITGNISGITYTWTAFTSGVNVVGGTTSGTITATSATTGFDLQVVTSNPLVAGTIYFEVSAIRNGCPALLIKQSNIVTVNPNPGLPIPSPIKTICSGEGADLRVDVSPLIAGTELTWQVLTEFGVSGAADGTGVAPVTINDILTTTTNAQGYVIYRVRSSLGDCQGGYTDFRVNVNPSPRPVLADSNICITASGEVYQTYTLNTGLNDADYDFEWFDTNGDPIPGETSSTLVVDAAGTYSVIATNWLTGCSSDPMLGSATATVNQTMPATTMAVIQSEYFSDNATITITVPDGTGTLLYQLDEGSFQSSNVFTGVSAGEHTVTVIDSEGCTYMTEVVMIIDYPNYFTPNGDGINDTWNITGLNQADAKLYIFDRYGKLLKQLSATTDSQGWDGTYNQELLPATDYWFSLDYTENGVAKQFKAHFSMKR